MTDNIGAGELIDAIKTAHIEPNAEIPAANTGQDSAPVGANSPGNPYGGIVDIDGTQFDPAVHCVREGTDDPVITKLGRFRKRKNANFGPGNSAGKSSPSPRVNLNLGDEGEADFSSGDDAVYGTVTQASPEKSKLKMAAATAAGLFIATGISIFGAEWQPAPDQSDRLGLQVAFEEYFEAKGIVDIPPGLALTMAMFGYAAPRIFKEKSTTLNRLQLFWSWTKYKYQEWRGASRANIGADGERQNATGKNNSQKSSSFWRSRPNS